MPLVHKYGIIFHMPVREQGELDGKVQGKGEDHLEFSLHLFYLSPIFRSHIDPRKFKDAHRYLNEIFWDYRKQY